MPGTSQISADLVLKFAAGDEPWRRSPKKLADSLSAVVQTGRALWVCSDESASVERLTAVAPLAGAATAVTYAEHTSFRLGDFVALPEDDDSEIDEEGIDVQWLSPDCGYLWMVGSHSWVRNRPAKGGSSLDGIAALSSVELAANRRVLMRVPTTVDPNGLPKLVPNCPDPADPGRSLEPGILIDLVAALADDDHLRAFTTIPGKDNGLDLEGLAVTPDGRIFLGLRGPVLRGWAVVLELQVDEVGSAARGKQLGLRRWPSGQLFIKHFLDLGGLGVRDLNIDGADLLILAGPTMDLDGPVQLWRWFDGAEPSASQLVRSAPDSLHPVLELPFGLGEDHAEGFTRFRSETGSAMLVVYDSPSDRRTLGAAGTVTADLFPWPERE